MTALPDCQFILKHDAEDIVTSEYAMFVSNIFVSPQTDILGESLLSKILSYKNALISPPSVKDLCDLLRLQQPHRSRFSLSVLGLRTLLLRPSVERPSARQKRMGCVLFEAVPARGPGEVE
ncbi:hypothetical protein L596_004412 [Steinernema carpocapsae]|uniref:Uncharacterized protein n=1 Tax=Steinernema carpocapsae TaxID=34508 RepID=A0A4U8UVQ6_STECR|nr:hypothetical protein L596_004412 [Steinernema carpocapsae]